MGAHARYADTTISEYIINCLKADGSLGLSYVRMCRSVDDVETEARFVMRLCKCAHVEVWRGEHLLSRFIRPSARPVSVGALF